MENVVVYGLQKRYSPERHYVFILEITRENVKTPTYVFRTYKEFCELDSKLHTAYKGNLSGCHRYVLLQILNFSFFLIKCNF